MPTVKRNFITDLAISLVATAAFCFLAGSILHFRFPFLADDYTFLSASLTQKNFDLSIFGAIFVRRPLATLINWFEFRNHLFERTSFPFFLFFFLHCLGFTLMWSWLLRQLKTNADSSTDFSLLNKAALTLLCLYPCYHETLYMALNLPYSLGVLLLSLALWSPNKVLRVILFTCSYMCLETYAPIAILVQSAPVLIRVIHKTDATPQERKARILADGLVRDWVLPDYATEPFLQWIMAKNGITQPVTLEK